MLKNTLLLSALIVALALGSLLVVDDVGTLRGQDRPARVEARQVEYKALPRNKIEELADAEAADFDVRLTRGLNVLAADGWRLAAIEPYHERRLGSGSIHFPVTYVFVRDK